MSNNTNLRIFWIIVLVGVVPMFTALIMFYSGAMRPTNTVNQGELLQRQTLGQWQLEYDERAWQQGTQWQVLHTMPNSCASTQCDTWRNALPSVIKLLGKDRDRVVLVQVGEQSGMLSSAKLSSLGEAVWLADPLGNLVMRYSLNLEPQQLLKDLKKLLKLSGIG